MWCTSRVVCLFKRGKEIEPRPNPYKSVGHTHTHARARLSSCRWLIHGFRLTTEQMTWYILGEMPRADFDELSVACNEQACSVRGFHSPILNTSVSTNISCAPLRTYSTKLPMRLQKLSIGGGDSWDLGQFRDK